MAFINVFLSSTGRDLADYREAAYRAVGMTFPKVLELSGSCPEILDRPDADGRPLGSLEGDCQEGPDGL